MPESRDHSSAEPSVLPPQAARNAPLPLQIEEVAGFVEARRALGPDAEEAVIAAFLERVGHVIDARVEQQIAERLPATKTDDNSVWITLGSIGLGIPVTGAISTMSSPSDAVMTAVAWAAIAVINVAYYRRRR